jgi:hypothetical protein
MHRDGVGKHAIGLEESSEHPEGAVARELRRGYRIGDQVLRPSLVNLARVPDQSAGEQQLSETAAPADHSRPPS